MNRDQAKRVLLTFRPGLRDHQDPEMAQALDLAKKDAELTQWLGQQADFYKEVARELRSIPLPPNLKSLILAQDKILTPFWRRREVLLAAACLVGALILGTLWAGRSQEDESFAGFRSRMVGFALRVYGMDLVTNDLVQIRQHLHERGAPADYQLTPGLLALPAMGGARLSWQDHPVAMVCFGRSQTSIVYLFVVEQSAVHEGKLPPTTPVVGELNGLTTATWQREGKLYLMATADADTLRQCVP